MRVLSFPELHSAKGIRFSRVHLNRLVIAGQFPRPIKLGSNTNGWLESELDSWLLHKAAERDGRTTAGAAS